MKIVTAGPMYMDIDAYGGCVAYAELLQKQGVEARAVSTAPLNESVPEAVRAWGNPLESNYAPSKDDVFVLIDVSDPEQLDPIVDLDRVEAIIDHHPGFETLWQERIGDKAYIETIGAACTLVYEFWKESGLLGRMSTLSARLLICGILDNTLNFGAKITTERDKAAYDDLIKRADLPDNWPATYFSECQKMILSDLARAVKQDTKSMTLKTFTEPMRIGQLAVWDASDVLKNQAALDSAMTGVEPYWFINVISIGEAKSYFLCANAALKVWLSELLNVTFDGNIAEADRMWLRKEIAKEDLETVEL
jgi:nanoRNase/pAp phosphatase (c-di-AMP/oligoRNAs hydrolase)